MLLVGTLGSSERGQSCSEKRFSDSNTCCDLERISTIFKLEDIFSLANLFVNRLNPGENSLAVTFWRGNKISNFLFFLFVRRKNPKQNKKKKFFKTKVLKHLERKERVVLP